MAILAVTLIYASIRLLRRRVDVMSVVFLVAAVIFLLADHADTIWSRSG